MTSHSNSEFPYNSYFLFKSFFPSFLHHKIIRAFVTSRQRNARTHSTFFPQQRVLPENPALFSTLPQNSSATARLRFPSSPSSHNHHQTHHHPLTSGKNHHYNTCCTKSHQPDIPPNLKSHPRASPSSQCH